MNGSPDKETAASSTSRKSFLDSAAWLSAITGAGYVLLYFYERGFCSYFGIPESFIEVDLVKLVYLPAGVAIIFFVIYAVSLFSRPLGEIKSIDPVFYPHIRQFFSTLVLAFFLSWVFGEIVYLLIGLTIATIFALIPAFPRRNCKTLVDRYRRENEIEDNPKNLENRFYNFLGHNTFRFLVFLMFAIWTSGLVGQGIARRKTEFLALTTNNSVSPDTLYALAEYPSSLICARIDSNNVISSKLTLLTRSYMSTHPEIIFWTRRFEADVTPIDSVVSTTPDSNSVIIDTIVGDSGTISSDVSK